MLHGNDELLRDAFAEAVKRDISKYSHYDNNQYILAYRQERKKRGEPEEAKYPLDTYADGDLIRMSLREISFAEQGWRTARDVNIAEYSVAILWMVANSPTLFKWTRELLSRHTRKDEEDKLEAVSETFTHLLSYGRSLVYFFRRGDGKDVGHISLLDLSRVGSNWKFMYFTFRCPSLLAVLLSCCFRELSWSRLPERLLFDLLWQFGLLR